MPSLKKMNPKSPNNEQRRRQISPPVPAPIRVCQGTRDSQHAHTGAESVRAFAGLERDVLQFRQVDFSDCYKATEPEELYRWIIAKIEANVNK